mgnify:CR=1 FL=1
MAKPKIQSVIDGTDSPHYKFVPSSDFYKKTGINRIRFAKIYKGEKAPLLHEVEALSRELGIPIKNFLNLN